MRVAWLAPFNLPLVAHRLPPLAGHYHPAPWVTNGARALTAAGGVELHLVTYDKGVDRDYEFEEQGIWFHVLRARVPLVPRALSLYQLDLPVFRRAIHRIDPEVVHGLGTENLFSLAAVLSDRPHVVSMQTVMAELVKTQRPFSRIWVHQSFLRVLERWTLKRASRVLVEAPFVVDMIKRVNSRIQASVVGNIVSQPFFDISDQPGPRGDRIFYVGSLVETKGVADAIRAFHRVAPSWPRIELHIAGTGAPAYLQQLVELANTGAGAARIVFRGFMTPDAIAAQYQQAAMILAPTHYDSSPNVVSEAMVGGVPVIAAGVGGLPYMLDDGKAGQLVPARAPAALAAAIERNLRDPAWASAAAEHGQRLARRRYSPQTFVSSLMSAYHEVSGVQGRASA